MITKLWSWIRNNRLHFILWLIFVTYESLLIGIFSGVFGRFENYLVHYSLNIFLFYFHIMIMDKLKFIHPGDYLKVVLLAASEILVYIPLLAILNRFFTSYNQPDPENILGINHRFVLGAVYRSLYFIFIATGFWFLKRYLKERQLTQDLEKNRLKEIIDREKIEKQLALAQNAYIKSQINPHFLFNTLSFIHKRIRKTDPASGDLIVGLSEMMRYAVDIDYDEEFTLLSKEIAQAENLINLFQIKQDFKLSIHFDYGELDPDQKIVPLALLTLVENVFKHGVLDDDSAPAKISIRSSSKVLVIETENKASKAPSSLSLHTGLKNLESRMRLVYGNSFSLLIDRNELFKVRLTVGTLKEN